MPRIRIALAGLSSSAKTSWAAQAHLPYLLSPRGKSHYEIVALLNSSVSAAQSAKEAFHLPPSTKTYGSPSALAADPDIDLVVINTRVDIHASIAAPALRAGKPRYAAWVESGKGEVGEGMEWPTLKDGVVRMRELGMVWDQVDGKA